MNKIELQGVVGRADVVSYNSNRVCKFSVVTEYSSRDKDGVSAVESLWFNVSLWESDDSPKPEIESIKKGAWVHLIGRLRVRKYTTSENDERSSLDVIARQVEVMARDGSSMQPQHDY